MNFDAAALAYVRYVLEEMQLKPGALAQKAGISASTLTRALNDPKHKFKLSMTTLEKIAGFSGISPAPFLDAKNSTQLTLDEAHRPHLFRPGAGEVGLDSHYKFTFIIGDVHAGKWIDPGPYNYMDYGPLQITHSSREVRDCFAYVVRDDSANMIAESGDILFCTKAEDDSIEDFVKERPEHADGRAAGPVLVERRSKNAFKVEHTARLIRRRRDGVAGWELVSAHYQDNFPEKGSEAKKPMVQRVFIDRYSGNDEIRVIGAIELVIRGDTTDALNWLIFDLP